MLQFGKVLGYILISSSVTSSDRLSEGEGTSYLETAGLKSPLSGTIGQMWFQMPPGFLLFCFLFLFTICKDNVHDKGALSCGWGRRGCQWLLRLGGSTEVYIILCSPLLCLLKIFQNKQHRDFVKELRILPKETCFIIKRDHNEMLNFCKGHVYFFRTKWSVG